MKTGTKSVLYGAHAFWLHPFFVAAAWWVLYGFPWDPRLWFAFFLHDVGYIGCEKMDDENGEKHPEVGAKIMHFLFDWGSDYWRNFTLLHSRHYAKTLGMKYSKLCVADKFAFCLTPAWLYIPMVTASGEIKEYLEEAANISEGAILAADPETAMILRGLQLAGFLKYKWDWNRYLY